MKYWILFIVIMVSGTLMAQDPMLQEGDRSLKDEVSTLTNAYNKALGLDGDQLVLFELKIEEFLIRREEIEAELSGIEKLETLYEMQAQETLEMQDILTHYQYQVYKQVKPDIQPIEIVSIPKAIITTTKE
ncbi:MAG: hypothetical protein ABI295_02175 [Xanthomarina sp.]